MAKAKRKTVEKTPGSKLFDIFVSYHMALEQIFAGRTDVYVDLATVSSLDDTVLVRPDGSLVSIFHLNGLFSTYAGDAFRRYLERLVEFFSPYLEHPGHQLQFVFRRDPASIDLYMDEIVQPAKTTLRKIGLDWDWILESRKSALKKFCAVEDTWLVFETNFGWMSKELANQVREEQKKSSLGKIFSAQSILDIETARVLYERHTAALASIKSELSSMGMMLEVLDARQALWDMRREIDYGATGKQWTPRLLGDEVAFRAPNHRPSSTRQGDMVLPPSIAKQIIPRPPQYVEGRTDMIRFGDRIYAPFFVSLPPASVQSFSDLLASIISMDDKTPFRISFTLLPDGLSFFGMKKILSNLFSFASRNLKYIRQAIEDLDELHGTGIAVTGLKISGCTWINDDEAKTGEHIGLLSRRVQMLIQALQAWGQTEATTSVGIPSQAVLSTVPGVTLSNPAPLAAAPLTHAIVLLPVNRQGSPWRTGALLFRSPDGKILPFQPGSGVQSSWGTIGFAPPGSGKSVLLSTILLASVMSPGRETIPYIGVVDIGPSSRGFIDLLRSSLPEHQKHLAIYEKLSNSLKYAINLFDTPLGLDRPTPGHKSMLVDFVSMLCTPDGEAAPPAGVTNLVTEAIDILYERFARKGEMERHYDPTRDTKIAEIVERNGIAIDAHTTWWEIVDRLFEQGLVTEAAWAQRYAVPTLGDLAVIVNSDQRIRMKFTGKIGETEQSVMDYVYEFITAAIGRYPMLSDATRFTLGTARAVALNLESVAPSGSAAAKKQSAIMYMLARHVLMSRCKIEEEVIDQAPLAYRSYYMKKIEELGPEVKIISFDEFHRTSGIEGIRNQIERDIREGRKYNTQVMIFSQDASDFTNMMVDFATTQFILGSGGDKLSGTRKGEEIKARFGLSDADMQQIDRLRGPTSLGAMAFMIAKTKNGDCRMLVYNTIGPKEMWALETNHWNRALREKIIQRVGLREGLEALARRFPSGSAVTEIEAYASNLVGDLKEEETDSVIEHFVKEVMGVK